MTIFLDIDNTLYDQSAPFFAALSEFFSGKYDSIAEKICLSYAIRSKESYYARDRGEMSGREMYVYRLQKGLSDAGVTVSEEEALALHECYQHFQKKISAPPETVDFLNCCRDRGIRMGIISNGPGEHQREKIKTLGLEAYFSPELVILSGEVGVSKPDGKIFEIAEDAAGESPNDLIYVGDSEENDVIPARAQGWTAIRYRKDPREWSGIFQKICELNK